MKTLDPNHIGLILGLFFAVVHAVWGAFVATGLAAWWLDLVTSLHFVNNPFTVQSFDITIAVTLIVVTFVVGYVAGWVLANIWNKVHEKK